VGASCRASIRDKDLIHWPFAAGAMTRSHPVTGDNHPLVVDRDKPPRAFRHCIKPQFQSINDFIGIAAYMLD